MVPAVLAAVALYTLAVVALTAWLVRRSLREEIATLAASHNELAVRVYCQHHAHKVLLADHEKLVQCHNTTVYYVTSNVAAFLAWMEFWSGSEAMKPNQFPSPTEDAIECDSPTAETRQQAGPDAYLRGCLFSIHARPKDAEPIWRGPDGKLYPQSEAVIVADKLSDGVEIT